GDAGKSTEIIVCTQRLGLTAGFVRGLIEKTFVTNNLAIVGKPKNYRIDIYAGSVSTDKPRSSDRVSEELGKYDPKIYKYYISHTQSDMVGDETRIDDRLNIFKSTKFMLVLGSLVTAVVLTVWLGNSFLNDNIYTQAKNKTVKEPSNVTQVKAAGGNVRQKAKIEEKPTIFDKYDFHISLNMGVYPRIVYEFVGISGAGHKVKLNPKILRRLGYKVMAHDNCFVEVSKGERMHFLGCDAGRSDVSTVAQVKNAIF
ncbi:MAG: hypothetical protein GY781_13790, partial [Gammaproteobacteria bacterium]|nr:hypothetical protein [Gammaproteobacteria bacterium]